MQHLDDTPPTATVAPTTASPALWGHEAILAMLVSCLVGLVVVLSTSNLRMAVFQVLPVVVAIVLGGGLTGGLLLARAPGRAWVPVVGAAVAAELAMLVAALLLAAIHSRSLLDVWSRPLLTRGLLAAPLLGALVGAVLWTLADARRRERIAWEAERMGRVAQEQLRHERTRAHLQLLHAQMEPHFVYNTLANLRQLIRVDGVRAQHMVEHLIHYFKRVLPGFRADQLPLGNELALVQAYIDLMGDRMDRAMQLQVDVPMSLTEHPLLPGALLCLAENAVKHGLSEEGTLLLVIRAQRRGAWCCVTVRDNGPGLVPQSTSQRNASGTGLSNLHERLRLVHGDASALELRNAHPGCEVELTVPWVGAE